MYFSHNKGKLDLKHGLRFCKFGVLLAIAIQYASSHNPLSHPHQSSHGSHAQMNTHVNLDQYRSIWHGILCGIMHGMRGTVGISKHGFMFSRTTPFGISQTKIFDKLLTPWELQQWMQYSILTKMYGPKVWTSKSHLTHFFNTVQNI